MGCLKLSDIFLCTHKSSFQDDTTLSYLPKLQAPMMSLFQCSLFDFQCSSSLFICSPYLQKLDPAVLAGLQLQQLRKNAVSFEWMMFQWAREELKKHTLGRLKNQ
jgi:hypothetical protein